MDQNLKLSDYFNNFQKFVIKHNKKYSSSQLPTDFKLKSFEHQIEDDDFNCGIYVYNFVIQYLSTRSIKNTNIDCGSPAASNFARNNDICTEVSPGRIILVLNNASQIPWNENGSMQMQIDETFPIHIATYTKTIKLTVDGPREPICMQSRF